MKHIFSKEALEAASNPDEMDHALQVVRAKLWIPLFGIGIVVAVGLAWSFVGRMPVNVTGFGVLINPGNVKVVQSQAPGLVEKVSVKPGDQLQEGDIVAVLQQPALEQLLQQAKENYDEINKTNSEALEANRNQFLAQLASIERQKQLLTEGKELSGNVNQSLEKRNQALLELAKDNLVSSEMLLQSESSLVEIKTKMAGYDAQIQALDLSLEQAKQKNIQTEFTLKNQIDESRRAVEKMELQLENNRHIRSKSGGKVMQLMVSAGTAVAFGTPVLSVATDESTQAMKNLCYFSVKDGKKIKPGMTIQVTPSTVKRERYGSIVGKVVSVSSFPVSQEAAMNIVGSKELAFALTGQGAMIEVETELQGASSPDSESGYEWTSRNPPVAVSQGTTTVNRVRVDDRAPITYVLPLLRTWFQGQKDDLTPEF
ncbi:MAG: NHLP bacteriocin system secretion protein [Porticoccaceae bacterium]|nr:NHLP bacteriocin system secretion protein [Porticoccaceae bacterium]|tara:strand:+ start:768 stop:2051 length:1284 start_codon:yes stop_codon:yes gene_type:complete